MVTLDKLVVLQYRSFTATPSSILSSLLCSGSDTVVSANIKCYQARSSTSRAGMGPSPFLDVPRRRIVGRSRLFGWYVPTVRRFEGGMPWLRGTCRPKQSLLGSRTPLFPCQLLATGNSGCYTNHQTAP